jgi:hypothetical protein
VRPLIDLQPLTLTGMDPGVLTGMDPPQGGLSRAV